MTNQRRKTMKCKNCDEVVRGDSHDCPSLGRTIRRSDDSAMFDSMIIGAVTNSALLGGLIGGDIVGGIVGDMLNGGLSE